MEDRSLSSRPLPGNMFSEEAKARRAARFAGTKFAPGPEELVDEDDDAKADRVRAALMTWTFKEKKDWSSLVRYHMLGRTSMA